MGTGKRVEQLNVDFRPIECSVPVVELPRYPRVIQSFLELQLGLSPLGIRAHGRLRPCREEKFVLKTKHPVNLVDELEAAENLLLNLVLGTENMCIVLLEPPDPSKPRESSGELVPVQSSEISHSNRQFFVRVGLVLEHEAVAGAVHGLQALALDLLAFLGLDQVEVVLIVLVVAGYLPEVGVEDVGGDHLFVPVLRVLFPHEVKQFVVNVRAVGKKEGRTGGEVAEEKQLLLSAQFSVVVFLGEFLLLVILLEEFLFRERDSINSLKRLPLAISKPVSVGRFVNLESSHYFGREDVGSTAQVYEVAHPEHTDVLVVLHFSVDYFCFKFVVAEHVNCLLLRYNELLEPQVPPHDFLN